MSKLLINNPIKKKPFFSIITVAKNDEKNIEKTIKSVTQQSFTNYEYIIVDGKSSDQTITKIRKFKKKINILISEEDDGIYYAMNKGIKFANGEIIVFINSGDLFTKNALEIVYNKFKKNKQIDCVFGTVLRHYTQKSILKSGFNLKKLIYNFDFATAHSTGFFLKKKLYNLLNNFNTKYKCSADYDIYYKILLKLKLNADSTSKKQLVGIVASGGFSSKISFFKHLKEETQIRSDNNQNIFLISIIFLNALIKHFFKKKFIIFLKFLRNKLSKAMLIMLR
jgi:glycosyltransferase involved in cell wall biosynthesis